MDGIKNTAGDGVATGAKGTMPLHIWLHEVELAAIHGGATPSWIGDRFGHRLCGWFDAGESVAGAVEMILFVLKREPMETRGEDEAAHLRDFIHEAVVAHGAALAVKPCTCPPKTRHAMCPQHGLKPGDRFISADGRASR